MLNNAFFPSLEVCQSRHPAGFLEQTHCCTTIFALAISTSVREDNGYVRGCFIMRDDNDHEDGDVVVATDSLLTRRRLFDRRIDVRGHCLPSSYRRADNKDQQIQFRSYLQRNNKLFQSQVIHFKKNVNFEKLFLSILGYTSKKTCGIDLYFR